MNRRNQIIILSILITLLVVYGLRKKLFIYQYRLFYGANYSNDRFGFGRGIVFTNRMIKEVDDLRKVDNYFLYYIGSGKGYNSFTTLDYTLEDVHLKILFDKLLLRGILDLDWDNWAKFSNSNFVDITSNKTIEERERDDK